MKDVVIIGAGISGLYTCYKALHNKVPKKNYIIIDKNDYIGGRIKSIEFHGKTIQLGAGVIRPSQVNVLNLLKILGIEVKEMTTTPIIQGVDINIDESIKKIKDVYDKNRNEIDKLYLNFFQFLNLYFDPEFVRKIVLASEFNDYLEADVHDTIYEYPLDDILVCKKKNYYIEGGWIKLVERLVEIIGREIIELNTEVKEIRKIKDGYELVIFDKIKMIKSIMKCKYLVVAGDISIKNIKWNVPLEYIDTLNYIGSIPFMRVYTYHDKYKLNNMIKTSSFLDKIIPIDENILMAGYCDSMRAVHLKKLLESNPGNSKMLIDKLIHQTISDMPKTLDLFYKYWAIGIHYYIPHDDKKLKTNFWNEGRIIFLGEMVSDLQGWVEGAIKDINSKIGNIEIISS